MDKHTYNWQRQMFLFLPDIFLLAVCVRALFSEIAIPINSINCTILWLHLKIHKTMAYLHVASIPHGSLIILFIAFAFSGLSSGVLFQYKAQ